jgi:HK97 family phage major capsid protein
MAGRFEVALKTFGGMRQVSQNIRTSTGADLPFPLMDDTANSASIIGENTALGSGPDLAFTQLTLKAYKYSSGIVLLPWELITDSAIDITSLVGDALGTRIARAQNTHFTTGDNSGKPQGATGTAMTVGVTGTSLAAGPTYANLIDLIYSVDAAYRSNAVFMFSDTTLATLRKLVDGNSRPLFWSDANSLATGVEGTLLGYRYIINNDMPALGTANAKSILFGDFSRGYLIRDVTTVQILRLNERYADTGQVAFVGHARGDGRLCDAGTHPIKCFKNAAS